MLANQHDCPNAAEKSGETHKEHKTTLAPPLIKHLASKGSEHHLQDGGNAVEGGSSLLIYVEYFAVKARLVNLPWHYVAGF
jgi:hypothetical protein